MRNLDLLLETAKVISDDKVLQSVSMAIRIDALEHFFFTITLIGIGTYAACKIINILLGR